MFDKIKGAKTAVALAAVAALALAGISGCAQSQPEPTSASDVYQRYIAADHGNYHMKGDIQLAMGASGMTMEMPMSLELESDGEAVHAKFDMSMLGGEMKMESYTVSENGKMVTYSKNDSEPGTILEDYADDISGQAEPASQWTVSESEATDITAELDKLMEKAFANAHFAKTEKGYTVSMPLSDLSAVAQESGTADEGDMASIGAAYGDIADMLGDIQVTFTFDKDCKLIGIAIPKTEIDTEVQGTKTQISIACDIVVDQHGQIAKIQVPEETLNAAKVGGAIKGAAKGVAAKSADKTAQDAFEKSSAPIADEPSGTSADTSSDAAQPSGSASAASSASENAASSEAASAK